MKLAHLHATNPTQYSSTPALAALEAHRRQLSEVAATDANWASKEAAELEHIRACGVAQSKVAELEQRAIDATADRRVYGKSDIDPSALADQITAAREAASTLIERARLGEAMLTRIRSQRATLRDQRLKLAEQTRLLCHAARSERLAEAMETLLESERNYVEAIQTAFGVAASIDELAREPGPQLPFAGYLNLPELLLQRPSHPAYRDRPSPMRDDIAKAITSIAEATSKEL